jgi:hypothetical protein
MKLPRTAARDEKEVEEVMQRLILCDCLSSSTSARALRVRQYLLSARIDDWPDLNPQPNITENSQVGFVELFFTQS